MIVLLGIAFFGLVAAGSVFWACFYDALMKRSGFRPDVRVKDTKPENIIDSATLRRVVAPFRRPPLSVCDMCAEDGASHVVTDGSNELHLCDDCWQPHVPRLEVTP